MGNIVQDIHCIRKDGNTAMVLGAYLWKTSEFHRFTVSRVIVMAMVI